MNLVQIDQNKFTYSSFIVERIIIRFGIGVPSSRKRPLFLNASTFIKKLTPVDQNLHIVLLATNDVDILRPRDLEKILQPMVSRPQ